MHCTVIFLLVATIFHGAVRPFEDSETHFFEDAPVMDEPPVLSLTGTQSHSSGHPSLAAELEKSEDPAARAIVDKFMLSVRLLTQAHEEKSIANQFWDGFVYQSCDQPMRMFNKYEVAKFLNKQDNFLLRPFTVKNCKATPYSATVTFSLEFPSIFNGTVFVTLIPLNDNFGAISVVSQC